jgi:hypothetical protein
MRIFEVDAGNTNTPDPKQLLGLVKFLNGRAEDTNAQKQISQDAFISIAQDLGINVNQTNLADLIAQEPLSNVLEPLDPNSGQVTFKGANIGPTAMPVNKAQDIVASAAKSAMKKDRGV